jgi:hypothetical protein
LIQCTEDHADLAAFQAMLAVQVWRINHNLLKI